MTTNWISTDRFEYTEAAKRVSEKHKTDEEKSVYVKTVDKENRCVKFRRVSEKYVPKEGEILHYGKI